MKRRYLLCLMFLIMSIFMITPAAAAEGKMNVAVICGTDDAKTSTKNMEKVLAKNKLSLWRLNKRVSYYYDIDERPATINSVDKILDNAFGSSTPQDINYLYVAAHGYPGTDEKYKVVFANTGLMLDTDKNAENNAYKFKDFVRKLIGYKGQFVVIMDCCFAENFYTTGIKSYPEHAGRFTVFCSSAKDEYAWGAFHTQFYTSNMVKALTYNTGNKKVPADSNKDGFVSVNELHKSVKWKELSSVHTYGNTNTLLFQFGYVKLSKKSVTVNLADTKTYNLGTAVKTYSCTSRQTPKWKTSNPSVATVSKNGKVTVHKAGTAVITAYLADKNGNMCLGSEASCTVNVKAPAIKLTKSSITLYKDQKTTLNALVTGSSKGVQWKSGNKKVATVSSKGKNKAQITAKKAGTTVITATIGTVKATCKVTVKNPTITLNKTSVSLFKGNSETLSASVKGASQKVTWKSSNKKVVTVSSKGTLTAVKAGTAQITAEANGVKATCSVTVKEKQTGEIYTVSDLKNVANNLSGTYYLMNDLNLASAEWKPLGSSSAPFTGKFYGGGHRISNLRISSNADFAGLFGVASGAVIQELEVTGSVKGGTYAGGIVGHLKSGSRLAYCINRASVSGTNQIGGLVGRTGESQIVNCLNYGIVTAGKRGCGGITADIYPSGGITDCVNMASVSGGTDLTGGITGGSTKGTVGGCYNAGSVTASSGRKGAIAGDNANYAGARTNNHFLKTATVNSGYSIVGTNCGTFSNLQNPGLQNAIAKILNRF